MESDAKMFMMAKNTGSTKMTMVSYFFKNSCMVVWENPLDFVRLNSCKQPIKMKNVFGQNDAFYACNILYHLSFKKS